MNTWRFCQVNFQNEEAFSGPNQSNILFENFHNYICFNAWYTSWVSGIGKLAEEIGTEWEKKYILAVLSSEALQFVSKNVL